ncbi:toll-like receptor 8 [Pholidichthys leucotaenia]
MMFIQLICVALLVLLSSVPVSTTRISYPKSLPCDVSEVNNTSEVKVDCTERSLIAIPNGIPRDVTNLTLTINHIPNLNSTSFHGLENLTEIDMRCNCVPIKIGPKDHMCTRSLTIEENTFTTLRNLRALYLDGNQLSSIPKGLPSNLLLLSLEVNHIYFLSKTNLSEIRNVELLYLGQNCYFRNPCNYSYYIEEDAFLEFDNLTLLSLKSNNLSIIPQRLPTSLKELYLYNNNIEKVTDEDFKNLTNLEILDISGNCPRCYNAPFPCTPCPNNAPLNISKTAFQTLMKLHTLRLHSNSLTSVPFEWFANTTELRILDLSSNFLARHIVDTGFPPYLNKLEELDLSFNYELQSHLFLWDVWYIYHFCRAKLKGYRHLKSTSTVYDAFVIYDKEDPAVSEWVIKELCVHLENCRDQCLTLCLEERDWIPGCPLIDNLSQSIHRSKRTVFILTQKYIKCGSFKTAFYMAHQRLMDEKDDVIVLIFLEKVSCNSKYLRLRKRLYKRSVLEWPTNPQAQPYFWFSLRSVLATEGTFLDKKFEKVIFKSIDLVTHNRGLCFKLPKPKLVIMRKQHTTCTMNVPCWMLLFYLCCHFKIQLAACAKPKWMLPQFPCDYTHLNTSEFKFDCKGRHLTEIPKDMPNNITEINLSDNAIKNVSAKSFLKLVNLTHLYLAKANKDKGLNISANAFKSLTKLQHLKLSGNNLRAIPDNLPHSVKKLELNSNKILELDNRSLAALSKVKHLDLSRNCYFRNICGKAFIIEDYSFAPMTKLENLSLSYNNLTRVPKGLPQSLETLLLDSNRIQHISNDDLKGLQNLKILKIQGNCPRCQNAPHPCEPCPNSSLDIDDNAFHNLSKLVTLNMGGNSLEYVKPSWFKSLNGLRVLFLSFNFLQKMITGDAKFLTKLPKLERLDLSFNFALQNYPVTLNLSKDFACLKALRTLHLQGLVFQNIGPDTLKPLYELRNLSALNLGTNFIIHTDSSIFKKFLNLSMIYLAENRLYPTQNNNPPNPSNGYIQRSAIPVSPFLKPHPKDFTYELLHGLIKQECFQTAGRVLILSSNNLFYISPHQFEGYGDVTCLNLSRNGFSAAPNGTEFSSLSNLTYLDLSFNKIDLAFDNAFKELNKLEVLDLSYNSHYFTAFGITLNLNFTKNLPVLRVLNMSFNSISTLTTKQMYSKSLAELQFTDNFLGTLWKDASYYMLFTNLSNLTVLDITNNKIKSIPDTVYQYLPCNLTVLRLSHNLLTDFQWDKLEFFHQLQILDLSHNWLSQVTNINSEISNTLTFLDLSYNHIVYLDNGFLKGLQSLKTLSLVHNQLTIINQSTFHSEPGHQIQTLLLQKNPFQCTCDSLDFILWIGKSNVKIPRLTTEVLCSTPENKKGQALIMFDIKQCVNDNVAFLFYSLTTFFTVVFMFVTTVAHLFYWDASYVLHYLKAKLKGYKSLSSPDSVYDAFVTYDTKDPQVSEWVMENLRVKLEEEGEKQHPLCLEERDWVPGVPLLDNLTQSIQYSRKTLFVLTEGYVKTGVFKLAMCLAHQRLLDENVDVIVLLMLEPVLQHSHFLRLRKRLCGKSVVEWPRMAAAEPWFWQNLRNVVRVDNQVMYNKNYSKYFTTWRRKTK